MIGALYGFGIDCCEPYSHGVLADRPVPFRPFNQVGQRVGVTPSSSMISRTHAWMGSSPSSTLPPGSSHIPARSFGTSAGQREVSWASRLNRQWLRRQRVTRSHDTLGRHCGGTKGFELPELRPQPHSASLKIAGHNTHGSELPAQNLRNVRVTGLQSLRACCGNPLRVIIENLNVVSELAFALLGVRRGGVAVMDQGRAQGLRINRAGPSKLGSALAVQDDVFTKVNGGNEFLTNPDACALPRQQDIIIRDLRLSWTLRSECRCQQWQ